MNDPKITRVADELLIRGKVLRPPVPVHKLAELLGASVRTGSMPSDLSGFLLRADGGPVIGVNNSHAKVRQRFTVAHELGHLLLHPDRSYVDRGGVQVHFRDQRSATAEDLAEMQANQFAADLLMPCRMIVAVVKKGSIDLYDENELRRVSRTFSVSTQALTFRLLNLGLATERTSRIGPRLIPESS